MAHFLYLHLVHSAQPHKSIQFQLHQVFMTYPAAISPSFQAKQTSFVSIFFFYLNSCTEDLRRIRATIESYYKNTLAGDPGGGRRHQWEYVPRIRHDSTSSLFVKWREILSTLTFIWCLASQSVFSRFAMCFSRAGQSEWFFVVENTCQRWGHCEFREELSLFMTNMWLCQLLGGW